MDEKQHKTVKEALKTMQNTSWEEAGGETLRKLFAYEIDFEVNKALLLYETEPGPWTTWQLYSALKLFRETTETNSAETESKETEQESEKLQNIKKQFAKAEKILEQETDINATSQELINGIHSSILWNRYLYDTGQLQNRDLEEPGNTLFEIQLVNQNRRVKTDLLAVGKTLKLLDSGENWEEPELEEEGNRPEGYQSKLTVQQQRHSIELLSRELKLYKESKLNLTGILVYLNNDFSYAGHMLLENYKILQMKNWTLAEIPLLLGWRMEKASSLSWKWNRTEENLNMKDFIEKNGIETAKTAVQLYVEQADKTTNLSSLKEMCRQAAKL